jgi:hypothetical protein
MRAALVALLLLAGCASASTVYGVRYDPLFQSSGLRLGGERPVLFTGSLPAGSDPAGIAALMVVPGWYKPTTFVPVTAPPGPGGGAWFVAAFGTEVAGEPCADPPAGSNPRLLSIALCVDGTTLARASLQRASGSDLESDLSLLMTALLPRQRQDRDGPCLTPQDC